METGGSIEHIHSPEDVDNTHLMRYQFAAQWVEGAEVLDAACGIGYGSALLHEAGAKSVHGVDVDAEVIATAQATYATDGLSFARSDVLAIEGSFDVVVSIETIEHLPDGEAWARHIAQRLLRREGVAIISTRVRHGGCLDDAPENPYHVREWSVPEFEAMMVDLFDRVEMHYQGFSQPPLGGPKLLKPFSRAVMYQRMAVGREQPVLTPAEWFAHYGFGPRYMVAVCFGAGVE